MRVFSFQIHSNRYDYFKLGLVENSPHFTYESL
jgi:hypothetical protein